MARNRNRTRCQRRLRRRGFDLEITRLRSDPVEERLRIPKLIFITQSWTVHNGGPDTPRHYRRQHLLPGEIIREAGKFYIHKGGKP
jgi:hypothetical protein